MARKSKNGKSNKNAAVETVARVTEISASSTESFERAIEAGVARATKTLEHVRGAWIKEMKVDIENGRISRYRVDMLVTFILND